MQAAEDYGMALPQDGIIKQTKHDLIQSLVVTGRDRDFLRFSCDIGRYILRACGNIVCDGDIPPVNPEFLELGVESLPFTS
jgi:hypothetical protein